MGRIAGFDIALISFMYGVGMPSQSRYVDSRAKCIVRNQTPAPVGVVSEELRSVKPPRKGKGSRRSRKNK
jgi:hypothetical protein